MDYRYDGGLAGTATLSGTWENISTENKPSNSYYGTLGYESTNYPQGAFMMTAVTSPGGVYGKVTDFITSAGVQGASVLLKDKEYTAEAATTDSEGNYKLQNVWIGKEYTVIALAENYGNQSLAVRIDKTEKDRGKRCDFTLRETIPPGVIVTNPFHGSSAISATVVITATFSEPMDANTINNTTFLLSNNASSVTGAVTYDADRNTAIFTPLSKLSNNSTYYATITTGVQDKAGNSMQSTYQWSFSTELNKAPLVNAGHDQNVNLLVGEIEAIATLNGFVTDDDIPRDETLVTLWTKIRGPGAVNFGNASEVDTTATFSSGGVYVLELMADEGDLTAKDTITINVNTAPVVDAGPDQNSNLVTALGMANVVSDIGAACWRKMEISKSMIQAGTSLDGAVADDGLPVPPGALTTLWTQLSGNGTVSFGNASDVDTTASFSSGGVYVLELTANDGALSTSDTVTINVNTAPVVDAGQDQNINGGVTANLDGAVADDGLPVPPGALTTLWTQLSGTGTVSFGNASDVDTTATFSSGGVYVLKLTANDGAITTSDTVTINVNTAPVVDAGTDQNINVGVTANLDGAVADDGLPVPPGALTTLWTQLSGTGTVSFGNASDVDTTASFSSSGVYVLELTADDGSLTTSDTVTIFVEEATITLMVDAAGVQGAAPVSINGAFIGYLLTNEVSGYLTSTFDADITLIHDGDNEVVVSAPYSSGTDSYDDIQITNLKLRKTHEEEFIFNDEGIYHLGDQSLAEILDSYNSGTWNDPNPPPFWTELTGNAKTVPFTMDLP